MKKKSPPSITQTMTNSPGGIQAGRDVVINQKPAQRELTAEQRDKFFMLVRAAPKCSIDVIAVLGDAEAYNFAAQLDELFKSNGWTTSGVSQGIFNAAPIGLILQVRDQASTPASAGILQNALGQLGFRAEGGFNNAVPPNTIKVIVGSQPRLPN